MAKFIALTQTCQLTEHKEVSIYTESRYDFRLVHDFEML